jgi:3-deoxy-D-manno-octulosonate 8-phosphate phosphatase (KDO 8-P phosphatase)
MTGVDASHWPQTVLTAAAGTELLVLDVDGVLTDGRLHYDAEGREAKVFHVRDGFGIKAAMACGIQVAVISGRASVPVQRRMQELGITQVVLGRDDKLIALRELCDRLGLDSLSGVAYVGDDLPDLPAIKAVGLGLTVADGHPEVLAAAMAATQRAGGYGAVREICDLLIQQRQHRA